MLGSTSLDHIQVEIRKLEDGLVGNSLEKTIGFHWWY